MISTGMLGRRPIKAAPPRIEPSRNAPPRMPNGAARPRSAAVIPSNPADEVCEAPT